MSEDAKVLVALFAALLGLFGVIYSSVMNYVRGREQDRFKARTDKDLAAFKANTDEKLTTFKANTDEKLATFKAKTDQELARLNAALQVERDKRLEEIAAKKVVSRFRDPLMHAAYDLQSRIFNILKRDFLDTYYTEGSSRYKEYVVENTVFLLAQFLGWTELIRQEIQFLDLGSDDETREMRRLQEVMFSQLDADPRQQDPSQTNPEGSGFRLAAGEQRAVGELMIERTAEQCRCQGFAAFLKHRNPDIDHWLDPLRADIIDMAKDITPFNTRLVNIQHALIDLLYFLDPDYVRFPEKSRTKV